MAPWNAQKWMISKARDFSHKEDGGYTIFGIALFIITVVFCGMAVDFMYIEYRRNTIQNQADAGSLAGAKLGQVATTVSDLRALQAGANTTEYGQPVEKLVHHFLKDVKGREFAEASMSQSFTADDEVKARDVIAKGDITSETWFLRWLQNDAFNELKTPIYTHAYIGDDQPYRKEISLVLDTSRSMAKDGAFDDMKEAAKLFVDLVLRENKNYETTLNVVPFSANVNIGNRGGGTSCNGAPCPNLWDAMTTEGVGVRFEYVNDDGELKVEHGIRRHNYDHPATTQYDSTDIADGRCIYFENGADVDDFEKAFIRSQGGSANDTKPYVQVQVFSRKEENKRPEMSPYYVNENPVQNKNAWTTAGRWQFMECPPRDNGVSVHLTDTQKIKNRIDKLDISWGTNTAVGVKWGLALLDPRSRLVVEHAVEDTAILNQRPQGLPVPYDDAITRKYIVLMSDGKNAPTHRLVDKFYYGERFDGMNYFNHTYDSPKIPTLGRNDLPPYLENAGWKIANREAKAQEFEQNGTPFVRAARAWRDKLGYAGTSIKDGYYMDDENFNKSYRQQLNAEIDRINVVRRKVGKADLPQLKKDDMIYENYSPEQLDKFTKQLCRKAKDKGVTIYTVFFDTGDPELDTEKKAAAKDLLKRCASSPAHFYETMSEDIAADFAAIAAGTDVARLKN